MDKYKDAMEEGCILEGLVLMYGKCEEVEEDVFIVSSSPRIILLNDNNLSREAKVNTIGQVVEYIPISVDYVNNKVIGSIKEAENVKQGLLKTNLKDTRNINGKIKSIQNWGAYIDICGVSLKISNKQVFSDYTMIHEVYKVGDVIDNIQINFRSYGKIDLEVVPKKVRQSNYQLNEISINKLYEGQEIKSYVRNLQPTGCYVYIMPGKDVICPVPDYLDEDIEDDSRVVVKLTQVDIDKNKLRGKIIKIID